VRAFTHYLSNTVGESKVPFGSGVNIRLAPTYELIAVEPEASMDLSKHAIMALESRGKDLGERADSAFRSVFAFAIDGEKFVVKIDKEKGYKGSHGCEYEAQFWADNKDRPLGKLLCPVLAHGTYKGQFFTVQPYLRTLEDERAERKDRYFMGNFHDEAMSYAAKLYPEYMDEVSDLHSGNWGVDSDGNYFIIDYSY